MAERRKKAGWEAESLPDRGAVSRLLYPWVQDALPPQMFRSEQGLSRFAIEGAAGSAYNNKRYQFS